MGLFHSSRSDHAHAAPAQRARPAGPARRGLVKRLPWELKLLILGPIYLGPPLLFAIAAAFIYYTVNIPDPMALRQTGRAPIVRILARDGALIAERGRGESYVPIDLLPQHVLDAVIATEDRRFFEHWGLDPVGLLRAALTNLRSGRIAQGGSTLTQQLAKNLILGSERTLSRKLEELVVALWLEMRLGKRSILELYLNRVYFGGGAYGIETASQRFFGKRAQDLTLPEAAVLAGLLKAPSKYSPVANPALARTRAHAVLAKMVDAGLLSQRAGDAAAAAPLQFAATSQRGQTGLDYAIEAVLEQLSSLIGPQTSEVTVETSIDASLQKRAQALVHDLLASEGDSANASQAGLVLLDLDGGIRAVVGGRSYLESQFNRALKAKRQPGSAFKLFVYLAALESGLKPDSKVLDLPILGSGWSPRNEGAGYRGSVTLREALAHSMNAAAARLHMSVGPRKTAAVAHRLGIRSELRADASLALGTSEVTLAELTSAYGVLAKGGRSLEAHIITRVRTASGEALYRWREEAPRQLVAPAQVAALNDMLSAVLTTGTGRRAALPRHPAAGKTGTSQDFRDAWFVGYTAHFVAGVWVGNDDGRSMHRVMGGSLPAKLWREVMLLAHEGRAPTALPGIQPTGDVLASSLRSEPKSERVGDPKSGQPLLPRDPITPDFVQRALDVEAAQESDSSRPGPPPTIGKSIGALFDKLRRGMGLGT